MLEWFLNRITSNKDLHFKLYIIIRFHIHVCWHNSFNIQTLIDFVWKIYNMITTQVERIQDANSVLSYNHPSGPVSTIFLLMFYHLDNQYITNPGVDSWKELFQIILSPCSLHFKFLEKTWEKYSDYFLQSH